MMIVRIKTVPGLEDVAAEHVSEIIESKGKVLRRGWIETEVKDFKEIVKLNYCGRAFTRVLLLLKEFEIKNLEDIYKGMIDIPFEEYLTEELSFAIRGEREGEHDFTSVDIGKPAGQAVIDRVLKERRFRPKVNLDNPDVIFRVRVENEICSVYLDTTGDISLHRRGYRVWPHPSALNPVIAFGMIKLSKWKPEEVLLDPFCGGATIPIEAALYARNIPPGKFRKDKFAFIKLPFFREEWFEEFEKEEREIKLKIYCTDKVLRFLMGGQSNARIAGVLDNIEFSRYEVEWLDIKFGEGVIDVIVTNPPYGIREHPKNLEKIYKMFFWNASFILKDDGRIVMITTQDRLVEKYSRENGFEIVHKRAVLHGDLDTRVFIIEKKR